MNHIGHVPSIGETATIDRFWFKVLDADSRRIRELQVVWLGNEEAEQRAAER